LGWVPFTNKYDSVTSGNDIDLNDVLNYDNITSSLCGASLSVQYEFTDQTIQVFIKSISCLPIEIDEAKRLNVKVAHSISKVDFNLLCNLVAISYQRINLDLEDLDIEQMIKNSPKSLQKMMNYREDQIEESIVHQMVTFSQAKFVLTILNLEGKIYEKTI